MKYFKQICIKSAVIVGSILFLKSIIHAETNTVSENAINCSALFYILTTIAVEKPKLGKKYTELSKIMAHIYAKNKPVIGNVRHPRYP